MNRPKQPPEDRAGLPSAPVGFTQHETILMEEREIESEETDQDPSVLEVTA